MFSCSPVYGTPLLLNIFTAGSQTLLQNSGSKWSNNYVYQMYAFEEKIFEVQANLGIGKLVFVLCNISREQWE